MLDPITSSPILMALAALAIFAVVVTALKFAIKIAVRVGIIAAIVLAGFYTVGTLL